ncbi:MAG TPA: aspartate aminotransferase family protein, partial [Kiloniellales bacterium]|nr:aspartate aminotransferase family protein [Kiloniellales bacterium]
SDKATKAGFDPVGSVGLHLFERCQANGLILRNLGDAIAFCPPLIISEQEIDQLLERFGKSLDETLEWMNSRSVAAE